MDSTGAALAPTEELESQPVRAGNINVGDTVHKMRDIWFVVASIEAGTDYVCFRSADNKHWKVARWDIRLTVKRTSWKG